MCSIRGTSIALVVFGFVMHTTSMQVSVDDSRLVEQSGQEDMFEKKPKKAGQNLRSDHQSKRSKEANEEGMRTHVNALHTTNKSETSDINNETLDLNSENVTVVLDAKNKTTDLHEKRRKHDKNGLGFVWKLKSAKNHTKCSVLDHNKLWAKTNVQDVETCQKLCGESCKAVFILSVNGVNNCQGFAKCNETASSSMLGDIYVKVHPNEVDQERKDEDQEKRVVDNETKHDDQETKEGAQVKVDQETKDEDQEMRVVDNETKHDDQETKEGAQVTKDGEQETKDKKHRSKDDEEKSLLFGWLR